MKFTVNVGDLSAALRGPCDRAKPTTIIPILKHIRVDAADVQISLLGHDLDSSSIATVDAEIAAPGACAIPAEPLARLIGGLPKASHAVFELDGRNVTIKSGRSRYKLPILDASDMPVALSAEGGFCFSASAGDLEQLFHRPRSAIDVKQPAPCFQGFYLHNEAGKIAAVTTDRHFLLRFSTGIDAGAYAGSIIPRRAADEILKIGSGEITVSDRIISIASGGRIYSSKIIDAIFPEHYRRTIPEASSKPATLYREAAIEALQRLRAVADFSESDLVDISVGDGELSFSVVGSADGSETIECEASDGSFVCLLGSQLLEALKVMEGDSVSFHIPNEREPFRMTDPSEPSAICVLMPCVSKTVRRAEAA